ncbi:MAG: SET domain-containing protein-lysine N-methyltransferase [Planctomycetes bacterium]|nr:SET domain-containing protein-lysine N-methyltransferase [Planctomycetota bacterium]
MNPTTSTLSSTDSFPLGVLRLNGRFHAVAGQAIPEGATILRLQGSTRPDATRYSIQVGWQEHLETFVPLEDESALDRWQVRFMNHSCDPNTRIADLQVIALRDIAAHEELTFDYNTTEWEMSESFACECGHCDGQRIAGFANLTAEEQRARLHRIPQYLRSRMK